MAEFIPAKTNAGIAALANSDSRMGQVRVFDKAIMTPMVISENGYIGIYQAGGKRGIKGIIPKYEDVPETLTIIHISKVNEFDLIVDNKSGLGGAILGGLIAGGGGMVVGQAISSGKAKSIDLQIKTSDFNNPQIIVPLYRPESTTGTVLSSSRPSLALGKSLLGKATGAVTGLAKQREQEIQELLSQLDNIYLAHKSSQNSGVVVQQSSDADELAKYKKLMDDGVITQDEFNAKKKQLLGL